MESNDDDDPLYNISRVGSIHTHYVLHEDTTGTTAAEHRRAIVWAAFSVVAACAVVLAWLAVPLRSYWIYSFLHIIPYYMWQVAIWYWFNDIFLPGMPRVMYWGMHVAWFIVFTVAAMVYSPLVASVGNRGAAFQYIGLLELFGSFITWALYAAYSGLELKPLLGCILSKAGVAAAWAFVLNFGVLYLPYSATAFQPLLVLFFYFVRGVSKVLMKVGMSLVVENTWTPAFPQIATSTLFSMYQRNLFKLEDSERGIAVLVGVAIALDIVYTAQATRWFYTHVYQGVQRRLLPKVYKDVTYEEHIARVVVSQVLRSSINVLTMLIFLICYVFLQRSWAGAYYEQILTVHIALPRLLTILSIAFCAECLCYLCSVLYFYSIEKNTLALIGTFFGGQGVCFMLFAFTLHFIQDVFVGMGTPCGDDWASSCASGPPFSGAGV